MNIKSVIKNLMTYDYLLFTNNPIRNMKRIFLLLVTSVFIHHVPRAQEITDTSIKVSVLDEVVFSANKFAEKKRFIVQRIDVIPSRFIATVNAQNTGDLL